MGRRAELIARYAEALRVHCGIEPDMPLLEGVTLGCGPLIYGLKTSRVDPASEAELAAVKENFLIRKLSLQDTSELDAAIASALAIYGDASTPKHRAVLYYLLTLQFGKEELFR